MRAGSVPKGSPNICAECRTRKVKCDGKCDVCNSCGRLKLNCSFREGDGHTDEITQPDASVIGRQEKTACGNCRSLKAKCSSESLSCRRWLRKRTACHYPSSKKHQGEPTETRRAPSRTQDAETEPTASANSEIVPPRPDSVFVLHMFEAFVH